MKDNIFNGEIENIKKMMIRVKDGNFNDINIKDEMDVTIAMECVKILNNADLILSYDCENYGELIVDKCKGINEDKPTYEINRIIRDKLAEGALVVINNYKSANQKPKKD
jgi:hypothetical protein